MSRFKLSRRTLLRGAAGAALALPFLDVMRAKAQTMGKRLIVMYTPNGTVPADFWPGYNEEEGLTLSPILQPLTRHKSDLIVVGGLDMLTAKKGPGDPHQRGTGGCLTGVQLLGGSFSGDDNKVAGWAGGISVDQLIADEIGGSSIFRSLEFGVMVEDPTVRGRISYRGANKPLPPENNPSQLYERIFEPGLSPAEKALRRQRRITVVDRTREQYIALQKRLGKEDKMRLQSHIESLNDLEKQLMRPGAEFGGQCQAHEVPDFGNGFDYSKIPEVGKAQIDLLALSFACDITRVATLMWTNSQSTASYPINLRFGDKTFTSSGGHHGLAHKGDDEAEFIAKNSAINKFFAEQMSYLIDKLKAIPEGDGTVFDNTLIVWTNEQTKGNTHNLGDLPYVLAGNMNGTLKTDQYVRMSPKLSDRKGSFDTHSHTRMLSSIIKAMGLGERAFGDPEFDSATLDELFK